MILIETRHIYHAYLLNPLNNKDSILHESIDKLRDICDDALKDVLHSN